jgi:hypothetical protein
MGRIYENISLDTLRKIVASDLEMLEDPFYAVDHDAIREHLPEAQEILARREAVDTYECLACGLPIRLVDQPAHNEGHHDSGTFSGDLTELIGEAYGWAWDNGRNFRTQRDILDYVVRQYDGGLEYFILANNDRRV